MSDQLASSIGKVFLKGNVTLQGEDVRLVQPCEITLSSGAHLVLSDVALTSQNLSVRSDSLSTASLTVLKSTLSAESGGLLVDLLGPRATVRIEDSQVRYRKGVWVRLIAAGSTDGDRTHTIEISDSVLASSDKSGDGIAVAASEHRGHLSIERVTIDDASEKAFLFAGTCAISDLRGAQARCRRGDPR